MERQCFGPHPKPNPTLEQIALHFCSLQTFVLGTPSHNANMKSTIFMHAITAVFGLGSAVMADTKLSPAEAELICGGLGVMNVTGLPEGVDPSAVRTCKEHPVDDGLPGDNPVDSLEKRKKKPGCWFGDSVGCSKGYCYKSCAQPGSGEWCWTAKNNGFGDWVKCKSSSDCDSDDACGAGGCKKCGCAC